MAVIFESSSNLPIFVVISTSGSSNTFWVLIILANEEKRDGVLFLSVVLKCHNILGKMERGVFSGLSAKACYVKSFRLVGITQKLDTAPLLAGSIKLNRKRVVLPIGGLFLK